MMWMQHAVSGSLTQRIVLGLGLLALTACLDATSNDGTGRQGPAPEADTVTSERLVARVELVTRGLRYPWGLAFLPDGRALVTERVGQLRILDGTQLSPPIGGLPDNLVARGQGGLLGVAVSPDFGEDRLIYLAYSGRGPGGLGTEVARARLVEQRSGPVRLADLEVVFAAQPKTRGGNHFGGQLLFHPDGTLFVTLGDRYHAMEQAQSLQDHLGTVVRINPDGSVPADNPFVDRADARAEIYSYGHRNVQGIALWPDGTVFTHEHGPRGGDELNRLKPGTNYGWPRITYGIDYSGAIISDETARPGMHQPLVYWDPSIAPSGMAAFRADGASPLEGSLFIGALAGRKLVGVTLDDSGRQVVAKSELLRGELGRIRAVVMGQDGHLYLLTDEANGGVYRVELG